MYCPKCGASNSDNASYCVACGYALRSSFASSVPPVNSVRRKDPIIAALLNFFLFGIGYMYLGYRRVLDIPTILFVLIVLVVYIVIGFFTFGLLELVLGIFLGYDGYIKAKGERGYLHTEPEYLYGSASV
jgi:uncharacterized membrane protein YvbJ